MIDIENTDTFVRTIYTGNAVTRVQSSDSVKIITVAIFWHFLTDALHGMLII